MRVYLMGLIIACGTVVPSAAFAQSAAQPAAQPVTQPATSGLVVASDTNEGEHVKTTEQEDAARYQALEAASPEVLAFEGGAGGGIYIGTGVAIVAAVVVLLLVLL